MRAIPTAAQGALAAPPPGFAFHHVAPKASDAGGWLLDLGGGNLALVDAEAFLDWLLPGGTTRRGRGQADAREAGASPMDSQEGVVTRGDQDNAQTRDAPAGEPDRLLDWGERLEAEYAHGRSVRTTKDLERARMDASASLVHAGSALQEADEELWQADPACRHEIVDAPGGGIRCRKCPGWLCH